MNRSLLPLAVLACHPAEPTIGVPTDSTGNESSTTGETGGTPVITGTVGGFTLQLDAHMPLMIHATFVDSGAEDAWVEYRFEGDDWLVAPTINPGAATILGIPPLTDVEARAVEVFGGKPLYSKTLTITTGDIPPILLVPTISNYDPRLAYTAQYAMISIATGNTFWRGPYFIEIFDRSGRIVWYERIPDNMFTLYPSVAFDGTHIWFERENIFNFGSGEPGVTRKTLDGRWLVDFPIPNLGQAIGEGPDDSFFYELRSPNAHGVNQLAADGSTQPIWDCDATMEGMGLDGSDCLLNTTNWDATRNTVLASQFLTSTVFEIDVETGEPLRQFGQIGVGDPWTFAPLDSMFAYQHFPNWTPQGTLLVSTHQPCGSQPGCDPTHGRDGIQLSSEYVLDDNTKTITRIGYIQSTDLWATQAGETYQLPNGNRILGYGQDGAVREYTPSGTVVWQAVWEQSNTGDRAVGHCSLIDNLYALNVGH